MMKYLYKTLALVLLGAAASACASLSSLQPAVGMDAQYEDALYASFDRLAEKHEQRLLDEEADRLMEKSRLAGRTLLAVDQATGDTLQLNLNLFDNDFMYGWRYNGFQRYGIPYRYGFPYRHGIYDPYYAFNAYGPYIGGYGFWTSPWYSGWSHTHWYTMHSFYGLYDPWYDPWYGPYGPYGHYGFGFGYYGYGYGMYDPWYGGWYDPWYSSWYSPWYDPWYEPWFGHGGWYGPMYSNRRPGQVWARRGTVAPEARPGMINPSRSVMPTKNTASPAGRIPVSGTKAAAPVKSASAVRTAAVRSSAPARPASVRQSAASTNSRVVNNNTRVVRSSDQNSYNRNNVNNQMNSQMNRTQSTSSVRQSIQSSTSHSSGGSYSGGSTRSTSTSSHSSGMGGRR